jgi:hypothetical protein
MKGKIEIVNADSTRYMHFYTGSGGLVDGTLAVLDSGTAIQASEGVASAILLGVVIGDYDAGEIATIYPLTGTELKMDIYQGGATDTFAAANVGTPFDIYVDTGATPDAFYIDPNDTTGAFLVLMSYDNTALKANLRALNSVIYVG